PRPMRALALLALLAIVSCHRSDEASASEESRRAARPLHVATTTVVERPMPQYLTLTGTLHASAVSEIAADVSGKVIETLIERGQPVKRAQVLVTIDPRSAALAATAAEAQSKAAQSQLEQARRECERVKHLLETAAISQAEYDRQTAQCTSQQWSTAAAEAQRRTATKILGDTSIRAPFDGVIGERYVTAGQYVEPSTRVASIYVPDPLRLELTVPEARISVVKAELAVTFTVGTYGDEHFSGVVKYISPNVREATRDLVVEAVVPNPDGRLKSGMFAVARVLVGNRVTPVVAAKAIVRDELGARAFVVVSKQIQERIVQIGETVDDVVGVAAGLEQGEIVVLQPGPDVRDGARVE
ncbi:MAG: efflux RND transporter periplasmic adaptor subunit, partial [Myxococcota bacterium]|nr:efflux RND transporter periplasmic adaptor subunit [Myxococcota bacterium]